MMPGRFRISTRSKPNWRSSNDRVSTELSEHDMNDEFRTLTKFNAGNGREGLLYSVPALEKQSVGKVSRLPISIRIVLEAVLRNCDGKKVRRRDVETLANWNAKEPANEEIPFVVARIVLQDFTGVPLVV